MGTRNGEPRTGQWSGADKDCALFVAVIGIHFEGQSLSFKFNESIVIHSPLKIFIN